MNYKKLKTMDFKFTGYNIFVSYIYMYNFFGEHDDLQKLVFRSFK